MIDFSLFKCKYLSADEIRMVTSRFRERYWPENIVPIDMERIITQRMNLEIIPEHNILMDAFLHNDLTAITVNIDEYMDDRYSNRLRFSFAHEIGHYELHHYIYQQLEFESIVEYCTFLENIPEKEYKAFEWQANEFAGSLLVPKDKLAKEINELIIAKNQGNIFALIDKYPDDILARVSNTLCKPFGVSTDVIERRAKDERLWPPVN